MALRVRAIDLTAETKQGEYGVLMHLKSGLNVISAGNTTGKSTLVQSIIYCLGLEKMLSPRREVPLPRVMTAELQENRESPFLPVLASRVQLEIENGSGEVITLCRVAKGEGDIRLVRLFRGAKVSEPEARHEHSDYYVLDPGAAQASTGLHHFLADYLGLDLPLVPRHGGGESPLYLEALFSLAFVEQKVGWSAIPANFPTYLGLKDMARRSVEFVLGLRVHEVEIQRQRVEARATACKERWTALTEEAHRLAEVVSARVEGMPTRPDLNWMSGSTTYLSIPDGDEWVEIDELSSRLRLELRQEKSRTVPTAEGDDPAVRAELTEALGRLAELRSVRQDLNGSLATERAQHRSTVRQLGNIEEDLRRHKDAAKILSLGGEIGAPLASDRCPTCKQELGDTLIPRESIEEPMSLEENRRFLLQQRDLFRNLESRGRALVEKQEKELALLGERTNRLNARVRALQDTRASASSEPSTAAIQRRVELQARLDNLAKISATFSKVVSDLEALREEFRAVKADEESLPSRGLPRGDQERLRAVSESVVQQLEAYGFSTFKPSDIRISDESYRPIREGFEIGFELSASDAIRLKWAYQLSLLEVTRGLGGAHHPGILVFDEPRQQETDPISFHELIARASQVPEDLQVVFTTSEEKPSLHAAIEDLEVNLVDLPGYLLQPR